MKICNKSENFNLILIFILTHLVMGILLCLREVVFLNYLREMNYHIKGVIYRLIIVLFFVFSYRQILISPLYKTNKKSVINYLSLYTFLSIVFYYLMLPGGGVIGSIGYYIIAPFCGECSGLDQYYKGIFLVYWGS